MYYYLQEAGIDKPWRSEECFVMASGDDVVVWLEPRHQASLELQL